VLILLFLVLCIQGPLSLATWCNPSTLPHPRILWMHPMAPLGQPRISFWCSFLLGVGSPKYPDSLEEIESTAPFKKFIDFLPLNRYERALYPKTLVKKWTIALFKILINTFKIYTRTIYTVNSLNIISIQISSTTQSKKICILKTILIACQKFAYF